MKLRPGFKLLVCIVLFSVGLWAGRVEAASITFDKFGLKHGSTISTSVNAPYLKDFGFAIIDDNLNITGWSGALIFYSTSPFFDVTDSSGNNSANRIDPIIAMQQGWSQFGCTEINFGGSASLDNIRFHPLPEPASMLLVGSGLIVLAGIGRKKFKKSGGTKAGKLL